MSTAELPALTRDNYDQDGYYIRHSAIEDFIKSPALYYHRHVLRKGREETDAMRFGSAVHCAVLDNQGEFDRLYTVAPNCDRRTKAGKEKWDEFLTESAGKTVLTREQANLVNVITHRLSRHDAANELLSRVKTTEQVITFEQDGLPCKARLDATLPGVILDLKTSRDPYPQAFARSVVNFGYHRQADWYMDAYKSVHGDRPRFVFIVVGVEPPHEVFIYELEERAILQASNENFRARLQLMECLANSDGHPWQHPDSLGVLKLSLPTWAYRGEVE